MMYEFRDVNENLTQQYIPTEALQINGELIETQIEGYRTLYVQGREALSPQLTTYEIGTKNGEIRKSKKYPARTITVGYQIISDSAEAFREAYNTLGGLLDVNDAELIFNDEPDKFFVGTPSKVSDIDAGSNSVTGEFEILCMDPLKYSVEEYEAEPSADDPGVFLIEYGGTYKSYPILEADFYDEDEAGVTAEDGSGTDTDTDSDSDTLTELTGNGDCGYVAFFNEQEKIIQLGDPEEEDGASAAKSQTLVSQSFNKASSWPAKTSNLWIKNNGKALLSDTVQNGSVGMKPFKYTGSSGGSSTSGTVLKKKKTASGNPRFYYTVSFKCTNRTSNSVKVSASIVASLGTDSNYFGKGLGLKGSIYCGGSWHTVTIKKESEYWKGRSGHTVSTSFTVSGLSASTTSLTNIKFKVARTDSLLANVAGELSSTDCSNMKISAYEPPSPSAYYLTASNYGSGTRYYGPTITRVLPADASGEVGAKDFTLTYKHEMRIGNSDSAEKQHGDFQALVISGSGSDRKVLAGVRIWKNHVGKKANLTFYVNGAVQSASGVADTVSVAYNNTRFRTSKSSTIQKSGSKITFNLGGIKATFKSNAYTDLTATQITFAFNKHSVDGKARDPLAYNGLYWVKFVKNNCDTWYDVPNKFSSNDVVEANCEEGEVYLNGVANPGLGALGNDWEEFYLKPGLNQIGYSYSDWVQEAYAPTVKVRYREVFL